MWNGVRQKSVYGRTRREVKEKLAEQRRQLEHGMDLSQKDVTVEAFLRRWLEEVSRPNNAPGTSERYEELMEKYLTPSLGRYKLRELNPQIVQTCINRIPKTVAPRTVRNIRNTLHTALQTALTWRMVEYNAADGVRVPKAPPLRPRALEPSQVMALFAAIRGRRLEALYLLATVMGIRQGELLALRKADVSLDTMELRIEGQLKKVGKEWRRLPTKTDASKRTLVIPDMPALVRALRRSLDDQRDNELLFPSEAGTPIIPRNLATSFKRICVRANIGVVVLKDGRKSSTIRFHDLRHTAGSWALAHGQDLKTTQEMLGHTMASTTSNLYGHVLQERKRDTVNTTVKKAFGWVTAEGEE
jgi:integrase